MFRKNLCVLLSVFCVYGISNVYGASKSSIRYPLSSAKTGSSRLRPSGAAASPKAQNYQRYKSVTGKIKASSATRQSYDAKFNKLPVSAQKELITVIQKQRIVAIKPPVMSKLPPMINTISAEVSPGKYGIIAGRFLNNACKVYLDLPMDLVLTSHYIWEVLVFKIPENRPLGAVQIYVKDFSTGKKSLGKITTVVAPRKYRGVNGFSFANFGTANISWNIYKNYFGADEVEFANGTRRPAAEEWYDSKYKGVGAGGDCYGMSMRSIRIRRQDWRGNHSVWWPNNRESRVWDYSKTNQVADSIRWDQGGQLSAQAAAVIADKSSNQDHQEAFNFIKAKIATHNTGNQPILGMWSNNGGHALVAYDTAVSGNDQKIYLWDNNRPYRTTVEDDENSVAIVKSNDKSFAYGGYHTMIAFTFNEMNPADPNLPASAAGNMNSLSAETTIITCSGKGAIKQIRDEKGRTLLDSRGRLNKNRATKIPNAAVFTPFTARTRRAAKSPEQLPVYIFNRSKGKNLIVDFDAPKDVVIRSFSRGRVNVVNARKGRFALAKILKPEQTLDIINPDSMRPKQLKIIRTGRDRTERVFDITPRGALPTKTLKFGLNSGGTNLMIQNRGTRGLNLGVGARRFAPNGAQLNKPVQNMTIQGGKNKMFNLQ